MNLRLSISCVVVSDLQAIGDEVRVLASALDRVNGAAGAAVGRAQEIGARAARAGFAGVAAGMARVCTALGEVRAALTPVGGSLGEAAVSLAAVPKEATPDQVVAALNAATGKVTAARDGVAGVAARLTDVQRLVLAVLQGGQPGPMVSALDGVRHGLAQVGQRCDAVNVRISAAVEEARKIGDAGN